MSAAGTGPVLDFGSDNHGGVHPDLLAAIADANSGHAAAYGADGWTEGAEAAFREHFGPAARAFGVFNGTGANVAAIDALCAPHEAVICTDIAHMHTDECGAPERLTGSKLVALPNQGGKLTPEALASLDHLRGEVHHSQPRVVSLTQATELGTVYTPAEVRALADAAHEREMYLHIDGARLANAAASLGVTLAEITTDAGADALSFGATKNGAMVGDAVVFLREDLAPDFEMHRKQLGQLASKMRFLSAQLEALLADGLWLRNAEHANAMAARLAAAVEAVDGVEVVAPVEANAVFALLPEAAAERLLAELPSAHPFHFFPHFGGVARWMCAWDTTAEDVDAFAAAVADAVAATG